MNKRTYNSVHPIHCYVNECGFSLPGKIHICPPISRPCVKTTQAPNFHTSIAIIQTTEHPNRLLYFQSPTAYLNE